MRPVEADFSVHPRPPRWAWGVVAVLALVAVGLSFGAWQARRAAALAADRLQAARLQRDELARAPRPPAAPRPYERSAREMLAERALPWAPALTALEATAMPGVTPRSVDAVAGEASVRVEVTAPDMATLRAYLDALNAGADAADLRWTLQQARQDAAAGGLLAVLVARPGAAARDVTAGPR